MELSEIMKHFGVYFLTQYVIETIPFEVHQLESVIIG
jgi:hypothetical protein